MLVPIARQCGVPDCECNPMATMLRLWTTLFLFKAAHGFVCPPNFCANATCPAVSAENCPGYLSNEGSVCGCCEVCIRTLEVGESCFSYAFLGLPPKAVCKAGLLCDMKTFVCRHTSTQQNTQHTVNGL
ncbi:uncharacterized protein LOC144109903 isoform X2 [Amblyomma americanum]